MSAFRGDLKFDQLRTSIHHSRSIGSTLRGGSGEAVHQPVMLQGEGFVIVRPGESQPERKAANRHAT
jgi:hypothetical protein